ncbi:MAG: putative Ig domain-containing protein [Nitrospirota bacterium]
MKRILLVLIALVVCCGCTKEQATQSGPSADGSLPMPVVNFAEILSPTMASDNPLALQFATVSGENRPDLFLIKWYVDGTVVDGVKVNVLEPQNFRKGSKVEAEVTPTDGTRLGAPFRAKAVVVKNSPPVVNAAKISPDPTHMGDTLTVAAEGTDRDGDAITFEVKWMVNNAIAAGSDTGQLDTTGLKKKDMIAAMVTPFDGEDRGTPYPTAYINISNRSPEITSLPPAGLQDGVYVYPVVAKDPDGDSVTFSLVSGPAGMTIDRSTGVIRWQPPVGEPRQQLSAKIAVEDGDGGVMYHEISLVIEMR